MYILSNTFGLKVGDNVVLVHSGGDLAIKQSGALRRKRAQISGLSASLMELNKAEMEQLKRSYPEEIGYAMGSAFGAVGAITGALVGSAVQNRKTEVGCRVTHQNGSYADLLCSR